MATDLFKRAAAYRKKHKGMTMPEAVKALSKGKVSGKAKPKAATRRKTVTGKAKAKTVKVTRTETISRKKGAARKTTGGTKVGRALKLEQEINSLEAKRKTAKTIDLKNVIQRQINKLHKDIRSIGRTI